MAENEASGGVGFLGMLALLFIGLKLGHVIAWSWWWVLCPLWLPAIFTLAVVVMVGIYWVFWK